MLTLIRAIWPNLIPIDAPLRTSRGQFNDALIVAETLVFRFPRTPGAAKSLAAETALLRALQGRLPIPVPNPEFVHLGADTGTNGCVGYRLLPGDALTQDAVAGLNAAALERVATQIAEFLRALHAIPRSDLPPDLPTGDDHASWANLYADFRRELFSYMRPDARASIAATFEHFLAGHADAAFTPVLRHGDLGGENIRYDPGTNTVTGIIDFGSAAFGDPAVDLAALSWYGEPFVAHLSRAYPILGDSAVRARAGFYRSTHALQQALWAIRAGDEAEFAGGIAAYT